MAPSADDRVDTTRPLRILHCPTNVGGHPQGLARAERAVGLDSRCVVLEPGVIPYDADEILAGADAGRLERERKRWTLLRRALRDYDVVHFNFGSSIMPSAQPLPNGSAARALAHLYARALELQDLRWLKRAGKAICVTFQGDDARQGEFARDHFAVTHAREPKLVHFDGATDAWRRRSIARFDRWADRIYALNPDLMHVLPERAEFLPYGNVDLRDWRPAERSPGPRPLVVHAPSDRETKGTKYIVSAVERLQEEGIDFSFELVEGLPPAEARERYERADVVIDQVLAGWYGSLGLEAMALGKPVVAYIRPDDLAFIPAAMRDELPVVSATPSTVQDVLRELLTSRRSELPELGRRARAYAERWHDPLRIAERLKTEYERIAGRSTEAREEQEATVSR